MHSFENRVAFTDNGVFKRTVALVLFGQLSTNAGLNPVTTQQSSWIVKRRDAHLRIVMFIFLTEKTDGLRKGVKETEQPSLNREGGLRHHSVEIPPKKM